MDTMQLTLFLWACTADKDTSSAETAAECTDESVTEGNYTPGQDGCLQSESLEEQCATSPFFDGWWEEDGCPSFTQYATYAFHNLNDLSEGLLTISRCSNNGISYDVIYYSRLCVDCSEGTTWIFDISGNMVSQDYSSGTLGDETRYCCEGHPVYYYTWGEQVPLSCFDATLYTVNDFPDSTDTAADTAITDTATTADSADTADTGTQ